MIIPAFIINKQKMLELLADNEITEIEVSKMLSRADTQINLTQIYKNEVTTDNDLEFNRLFIEESSLPLVKLKSIDEIKSTLNANGDNELAELHFYEDSMRRYCNKTGKITDFDSTDNCIKLDLSGFWFSTEWIDLINASEYTGNININKKLNGLLI